MSRVEVERLQDIPNVGAAMEKHLRVLGITEPGDLSGRDPYQMYEELCRLTGRRQDPCVIDVFISAVRYLAGEPPRKWWQYSHERKEKLRDDLSR